MPPLEEMNPDDLPASYAFVLKLADQVGSVEIIAATFAHRGVSLACSLGNDGAPDPDGHATMIVTFSAPPAKKEIIRRALGRLSRVRSLTEYPLDSPHLRKTAVLRVAGELPPDGPSLVRLEEIVRDEASGETTYLVVDRPGVVDAFLNQLRTEGRLRGVATTVIGL